MTEVDFLAHASFLITSSEGLRVLTDPYESGGFSGRVGYAPIQEEVDLVVITHDHLDHCHTRSLPGDFEVIRHAGEFRGVSVRSVAAFHDEFEGRRFGGLIDMKMITIDQLRFCHCGDLGEQLDDPTKREAIGEIDILIIPTGGYYTLGPDGAAEVTRRLRPRLVIPCHYKGAHCGFKIATLDPFLALFESEKIIEVEGSSVMLSPESLPPRPLEGELPHCLPLRMRLDHSTALHHGDDLQGNTATAADQMG